MKLATAMDNNETGQNNKMADLFDVVSESGLYIWRLKQNVVLPRGNLQSRRPARTCTRRRPGSGLKGHIKGPTRPGTEIDPFTE